MRVYQRIVDHEESARQARKKLGEAMKNPETKQESRRILQTQVRLSDQKAQRSKADKALKNHLRQDHAQETPFARQNLRHLRQAFYLAQEMGKELAASALLQRKVQAE